MKRLWQKLPALESVHVVWHVRDAQGIGYKWALGSLAFALLELWEQGKLHKLTQVEFLDQWNIEGEDGVCRVVESWGNGRPQHDPGEQEL